MSKLLKELILQNIGKHLEFRDAVKLLFLSKDFYDAKMKVFCRSIVSRPENLENITRLFCSETAEIKIKVDPMYDCQTNTKKVEELLDIVKKSGFKNLCLDIEGNEYYIHQIFGQLALNLESLKIVAKTNAVNLSFDFKNINVKRFSIHSSTVFLSLLSSDDVLKELEEIEIVPMKINFCTFRMKSLKANKLKFFHTEFFTQLFNRIPCIIVNTKKLLFDSCLFNVTNSIEVVNSDIEEIVFQKIRSFGYFETIKLAINSDELKKLILDSEKKLNFIMHFKRMNLRIKELQCKNCGLSITNSRNSEQYDELVIDTLTIDWSIPDRDQNVPPDRYLMLWKCTVNNLNIQTIMKMNKLEFNETKIQNLKIYVHSTKYELFLYPKNVSIENMIIFTDVCKVLVIEQRPYTQGIKNLKIVTKNDICVKSEIPYVLEC
jgi:hypothetical protein